jgi:glucose/arabinose dehydrogenase
VPRFVQADLAGAGELELRDSTPALVLDPRDELHVLALELVDGPLDVIAHEEQGVVSRPAAPAGAGMDRDLGGRQGEDQPALAGIDPLEPQHVAKEVPSSLGVLSEDDRVYSGDHGGIVAVATPDRAGDACQTSYGPAMERVTGTKQEALEAGGRRHRVGEAGLDRREGLRGAVVVVAILLFAAPPVSATASELPERFEEEIALSGLHEPTAVEFSSDGRVFVAEKSGLIEVFADLDDPTPTEFADLRTEVHNFWDRGLLGLALDPEFPAEPYVYALYTYDFDPATPDVVPRWGIPGATADGCPTPPGPTGDGCIVSARLVRLEAAGDVITGPEQVLIDAEWCQQYPSHSIGSLRFGADGALYASAGDGASFDFADYGNRGNPLNPCGDPPVGVGEVQTAPTAEGGALRSQDLRTSADPTGLNGSILRLDPQTGDPLPDNPGTGDANARRIIAHGLRNPFRFTVRPGTDELWVGDVGWTRWEEINRLPDPADARIENFGWPCYEGEARQSDYDALNLSLCEGLYDEGTASAPYYAYHHSQKVVAGESCPSGGGVISGLAFYEGGIYPAAYDGALFFADHGRRCIWAMREGASGDPDPADIVTFAADAANPVDLKIGPGGDLFYVDFNGGTLRRISYLSENQSPTAVATANVTAGFAPLEVDFDGTGSSDPDVGDSLDYAWDLDGDGQFDDSTEPEATFTYDPGVHEVRLRVTDSEGASDATDPITITADREPWLPRACALDSPNLIVGTNAAERLVGTAAADAIVGFDGGDVAVGLGGADCLVGGSGRDLLRGKAGDDRVLGGAGADRLLGDAGDDLLKGGRGNDLLRGGPGREVVRCGPGRDQVVVQGRDRVAGDCEIMR